MTSLSEPRFQDEDAARELIETSRWADGIVCPFCGSLNEHRMAGKTQAGYFLCNDCRDKYTCRTGTMMERSHVPLHKWLLAIHLMASNKNGVSALQLMRNLDLNSYRTAWFLAHRIQEAMTGEAIPTGGLGGEGKIIEADEVYIGGSKKNRAHSEPAPKKAPSSSGGIIRSQPPRAPSLHFSSATGQMATDRLSATPLRPEPRRTSRVRSGRIVCRP